MARRAPAWLWNELARHWLAIGVIMVVSAITGFIAGSVAHDLAAMTEVSLVSAMLVYALYGPLYLILTRLAFARLRGDELRDALRRSRPPRNRWVRLLLGFGATTWGLTITIIALVSIATLAVADVLQGSVLLMVAAVASLVGAWVLLLSVFAVEYARVWADRDDIEFPGDDERRALLDFIYLSAQVSTTFSTSDVQLRSTSARRLVTVHSITAFAFSTVIVALFVSILLTRL